jgi:hypothetical protein
MYKELSKILISAHRLEPSKRCVRRGFGNTAKQQEIDPCTQGYNHSYNYFCGNGRTHSEHPCDDHTHKEAYIIGYNHAAQDGVDLMIQDWKRKFDLTKICID